MTEKLEAKTLDTTLPTTAIIKELQERIATGKKVTTIDKGASNTVHAIYSLRLNGEAYIVKTYEPVMRKIRDVGKNTDRMEAVGSRELAENMRASIMFHRTFFELAPYMVDTDVAIADLGDGEGERVCIIQKRAKGRKLSVHMAKMVDKKTRERYTKVWAYDKNDTQEMQKARELITLNMVRGYALRLKKMIGQHREQYVSEEDMLDGIMRAARELDEILATFLTNLLRLLEYSESEREKIYGEAGIKFAMKSSADRSTEAVPPGRGIVAPDLFRPRNIMENLKSGQARLFDVSDLRHFNDIEELMDYYVTSIRQAFLFHYDPKIIRDRLKMNGDLKSAARARVHPATLASDIPFIPGEYSLLLPLLPRTEKKLHAMTGKYKSLKLVTHKRKRIASINLPASLAQANSAMRTSGD